MTNTETLQRLISMAIKYGYGAQAKEAEAVLAGDDETAIAAEVKRMFSAMAPRAKEEFATFRG